MKQVSWVRYSVSYHFIITCATRYTCRMCEQRQSTTFHLTPSNTATSNPTTFALSCEATSTTYLTLISWGNDHAARERTVFQLRWEVHSRAQVLLWNLSSHRWSWWWQWTLKRQPKYRPQFLNPTQAWPDPSPNQFLCPFRSFISKDVASSEPGFASARRHPHQWSKHTQLSAGVPRSFSGP